jgi:hypothetical protein
MSQISPVSRNAALAATYKTDNNLGTKNQIRMLRMCSMTSNTLVTF